MKKQDQEKMESKYSKIIDPRRKEEIRLNQKYQSNLESWSQVEKVHILFKIWLNFRDTKTSKNERKNRKKMNWTTKTNFSNTKKRYLKGIKKRKDRENSCRNSSKKYFWKHICNRLFGFDISHVWNILKHKKLFVIYSKFKYLKLKLN